MNLTVKNHQVESDLCQISLWIFEPLVHEINHMKSHNSVYYNILYERERERIPQIYKLKGLSLSHAKQYFGKERYHLLNHVVVLYSNKAISKAPKDCTILCYRTKGNCFIVVTITLFF